MLPDVSKEEYILWKNNKVTKTFWAYVLNGNIQDRAQMLVGGSTLGDNVAQATSHAIGYIAALTDIYNYEWEEAEDADQTDGAQSPSSN